MNRDRLQKFATRTFAERLNLFGGETKIRTEYGSARCVSGNRQTLRKQTQHGEVEMSGFRVELANGEVARLKIRNGTQVMIGEETFRVWPFSTQAASPATMLTLELEH